MTNDSTTSRPTTGHPGDVRPDEATYEPTDAINLLRSYTRHRAFVQLAMKLIVQEVERRMLRHDLSKLLDDEFAGFSRINKAARVNKFGSEEYKDGMRRERVVIDLHFSRNSHHPEERFMTFLDVIEMVCDWWGARAGYDDARSWEESVELNFKSKGKMLTPAQAWLAREVAAFLGQQGA